MGRRTWVKIYCDKWLRGTLRAESASVRGIWADIIALAGDSSAGDIGIISVSNHIGYPDDLISKIINVTLSEWMVAKKRLLDTDRIRVDKNDVITVVNWTKYQSEYQRTRTAPTRRKSTPESTPESTPKSADKKEKEKEKKKEKKTPLTPQGKDGMFGRFWGAYPKKQNKPAAKKAWQKLVRIGEMCPDLVSKMITVIDVMKTSDEWTKDKGKFIPLPSSWLNGRRWEDEISGGESEHDRQRRLAVMF